MSMIEDSLKNLIQYCEKVNHKGYDPYDILNSPILNILPGKLIPSVFIQIQKRNPFNIRPFLGIKTGYNPKAMGLFLKAYCLLYKKTNQEFYLAQASWIFDWLSKNYSKGFSGYAWGYNFPWASPESYILKGVPSVVVTSFVIDGILEYYNLTQNKQAKEIILSASQYIILDIPKYSYPNGIGFAYTHHSEGVCYNASLHAAEILAKADLVGNGDRNKVMIDDAVNLVISDQLPNGRWNYSFGPGINNIRKQTDFHQGFILVSLNNIQVLTKNPRPDVMESIKKGLEFYKNNQFTPEGRAYWRLPSKWPTDIHNQSQGIITFSCLKEYSSDYYDFARIIAKWTISNMQDKSGYFYYKKYPYFTNKIGYIRWAQAWMLLAFAEFLMNE